MKGGERFISSDFNQLVLIRGHSQPRNFRQVDVARDILMESLCHAGNINQTDFKLAANQKFCLSVKPMKGPMTSGKMSYIYHS